MNTEPDNSDISDFFTSYEATTGRAVRVAFFEENKIREIVDNMGRVGWKLPDCTYREDRKESISVANYRVWPEVAKGWIVQTEVSDRKTCMVLDKGLNRIPSDLWTDIVDAVEGLDGYPVIDEQVYSNVQMEMQDEAWEETYRDEFKEKLIDMFDEEIVDMNRGVFLREKLLDITDEQLDQIFYKYCSASSPDWTEDSGSMYIDLDKVVEDLTAQDVIDVIAPEDPRQMKFAFATEAKRVIDELLSKGRFLVESKLAGRIAALLLEDSYDYSCVMVNLPEELGNEIIAWGRTVVGDKDLFVDEDDGKGREDEPHVTVLYGLTDANPTDQLKGVLSRTAPFDVKLGSVSLFKQDDYDVVKLEVTSPFLHALNADVRSAVPYKNDYPDYKPHVTIAYVKKGTCDHLEGSSPWDDQVKLGVTKLGQEGQFTARSVVFSSSEGHKVTLQLGTGQKDESVLSHVDCYQAITGQDPTSPERVSKWIRESSRVYYKETGKVDGFNRWLSEMADNNEGDIEKFVASSGVLDEPYKASFAAIRRVVGRHVIDSVNIETKDGSEHSDCRLVIVFKSNGRADSPRKIWKTDFASFAVLKWTLRSWTNLKGAPLFINGQASGQVSSRNPALAE